MNKFQSEYATVEYVEKDKVVFLTWKKAAYIENYRQPTLFALELLRENEGSNFVVDARNGFEDDERDVEWGFQYLLPQMSGTSCRFVSFILNENNNSIEDEMNMWTMEFGKYFGVTIATCYQDAIKSLHHFLLADVTYTIKEGKREEFLLEMKESDIIDASRKEPGNVCYQVYIPIDSKDRICLKEIWTNKMAQKRHTTTSHYKNLTKLKEEYVEEVLIDVYEIMG